MSHQFKHSSVLAQNRTEEIGHDVWKHYVIPPFFDQLNLTSSRKPKIFIGGRGCGKTMLLRYLSHESVFSPDREGLPPEALSRVGIYWRIDTQFANSMSLRGVEAEVWETAFNHMAAIAIARSILESLKSMDQALARHGDALSLDQLDFSELGAFDRDIPAEYGDLYRLLTARKREFESWLNNIRSKPQSPFLPGKHFVEALIETIALQRERLQSTTFFVYLDEYENLLDYQKRIVNTWLKHSEPPLVFNFAMKRNSFGVRETTGPESLSDVHDFREHDLDGYDDARFSAFAAEIVFLRLSEEHERSKNVDPDMLRDVTQLNQRNEPEYRAAIVGKAQRLLPRLTQRELARAVFTDNTLLRQLQNRIAKALKSRRSNASVDDFIRPNSPEASVVVPTLLFRKTINAEEVLNELRLLETVGAGRFADTTGWIQNYFIGSLLLLYVPLTRSCPWYAGFDTFCHLSHGNIRHLLELCYQSLINGQSSSRSMNHPVDIDRQAEAARQASTGFLTEIRSFGRLGNHLHKFVIRLGQLFQAAHRRESQSESEQSHFSILDGEASLTDSERDLLSEAIKWSVLYQEDGTKQKSQFQGEHSDYILNPIYAPYFHISYRKKRKLALLGNQIHVLMSGSPSEFSALMQYFETGWKHSSGDLPSLFDEGH